MVRTGEMVERSRRRPLPISILPTLFDRRTRAGNVAAHDAGSSWRPGMGRRDSDRHPHQQCCRPDPAVEEDYPGRGLAAYRRALNWILGEDARALEQAA
jgi:chromosome partitioning protein